MLPVHMRKQAKTFNAFVDLPINNPYCDHIDMVNGRWYHCSLCDIKVKGRKGCSSTMSRWDENTATDLPHDERPRMLTVLMELEKRR